MMFGRLQRVWGRHFRSLLVEMKFPMLRILLMKDQPLKRLSVWMILKLALRQGEKERRHQLFGRN
ncbi:hypothetical protein ES319_A06G111500v1 [Gossypium barbadense]|uniref:Uncharacterized protein n=1 Tax=Gossypium barbadense TaxID=3634 RepID=A0A5J5VCV3_GOSBA|nr:hypothetical protein ES319_A06G111500v1 [Gossypium barbadense]